MAKDREKLFADDKAITFQRAVFIVCNLKRLIRRPKKDEKHGQGSGTRKRSGTEDENQERSGYGSRRNRSRNPVRRAFTLPTMLCNNFSVALAQQIGINQQQQSQVDNQLATFNQPSSQTPDPQQQYRYDRDGCLPVWEYLKDGRDRPSSYNLLEADYERARNDNTFEDAKLHNNSNHSSQDSYQQLNWQSYAPNRASVSYENNNSKLATMTTINNMNSLSCLITPIRRSNQQSNDKQYEGRSLSSGVDIIVPFGSVTNPREPLEADGGTALEQSNRLASGGQRQRTNSTLQTRYPYQARLTGNEHLTGNFYPQSIAQAAPNNQQVFCPVWAHVMAKLDFIQGQPRDQTRFSHLIGPPSSAPYLMAPEEIIISKNGGRESIRFESSKSTSESAVESFILPRSLSQDSHLDRHNDNDGDNDDNGDGNDEEDDDDDEEENQEEKEEQEDYNRPDFKRRLSGELSSSSGQGRARAQSCKHDGFDHRTGRQSKNKNNSNNLEDERYNLSSSLVRKQQQHSMISPNRSEQIDGESYENASNRQSKLSGQIGGRGQQKRVEHSEQMQMKRFSSAICLVENKRMTKNSKMQKKNQSKRQPQQQQQQVFMFSEEAQESPNKRSKKAQDLAVSKQMIQQELRKKSSAASKSQQLQEEQDQLYAGISGRKGSKGAGQQQKHGSLLEPQDPIILARQRRPSASNQGSVNVDQQALFSAVECNQFERVKTILEKGKANVNSLNGDKLTCLDVAALMRNVEMVCLLQLYNAKESSAYLSREGRANQLYSLYTEARQLVEDLSRSLQAILPANDQLPQHQAQQQASATTDLIGQPCEPLMLATGSLLSSALYEEKQRQLQYWKRRLDLFTHMRYEFERLEIPSPPELIVLQVVGETSLGVKIVHSLRANKSVCSATEMAQAVVAATNKHQQHGHNEEKLLSNEHHQLQLQQQQQPPPTSSSPTSSILPAPFDSSSLMFGMRTPPEALRACRDLKCSHWNTLIGGRPTTTNQAALFNPDHGFQQANQVIGQIDSKIISNIENSTNSTTYDSLGNQIPNKASEREALLLKQQKLALFNQILAQQLMLLSYQQSQNQLGYLGYYHDDNDVLSTMSSHNNQISPSACDNKVINNNQQQQQQQQRQKVALNQNTSVPHGVVDGGGALTGSQLNNNRINSNYNMNFFNRRQLISANDIILGTENIPCNVNAFEKCTSIAYKLMTANCKRNNNARHFNRTFDNSSLQSSMYQHQHQYQHTITSKSKENFQNDTDDEKSCKLKTTLRDQSSWLSSSDSSDNRVIITKYKVEWSLNEQMNPIINSMIIYNTNSYPLECQIENLINNKLYYVRVSSGNHKGFSESRPTTPVCLCPSSWRQIDGNKRRKYDEEVFKRFTKLILLNKHILDDFQTVSSGNNQLFQQHQQQQIMFSSSNSSGNNHNKSSLINMLLLDATMPSSEQLKNENRLSERHFTGNERYNLNQFSQQQQQQQSSSSVRKNLKNFFQSNSFKFHKLNNQNKRGLYLTTVIYNQISKCSSSSSGSNKRFSTSSGKQVVNIDQTAFGSSSNDKIVVTNDDRLPIIEVVNDLVSPAALMSDFYWLLKINGTQWMDIKRLRQQLQKSHSSSTLHLRIKLLSAIEQMQVALNMEDIGRIFYKPIQAHDGSMLICTCKQVTNTKLVSNLSIKWTNQHKIIPRHLRKISNTMLNPTNQSENNQRPQHRQQQTRESFASSSSDRTYSVSISSSKQGNKKDKTTNELVYLLMMNANVSSGGQSAKQQQQLDAQQTIDQINTYAISSSSSSSAQNKTNQSNYLGYATYNNNNNNNNSSSSYNDNIFNRHPQVNELFRLCEYCQYALIQRRSTMASASSSSSLASSNESQWSIAQQSNIIMPTPSLLNVNSGANQTNNITTTTAPITAASNMFNRCTCNRSNSSVTASLTSNATMLQSSNTHQSNPIFLHSNSARNSTSIGSTRSGSMISSTTPTHYPSISCSSPSARQSQANQFLSSAQKSSTYLMLASLSLYDLLLFNLNEIIEFDQTSTKPLKRGLYLGFVQLQTTVESMRLLVPRSRPNMVPCSRIRDNSHVSKEEWQLLKRFASLSAQQQQQQVASGPLGTPSRPQTIAPVENSCINAEPDERCSDTSFSSQVWNLDEKKHTNTSQHKCDRMTINEGYLDTKLSLKDTEISQTQTINHHHHHHHDHETTSDNKTSQKKSERSRTKSASPSLMRESDLANAIVTIEDRLKQQQQAKDCLSISSDRIGSDRNGSESIVSTHSCLDLVSSRVRPEKRVGNINDSSSSSKSVDERNMSLLDAPKTYEQDRITNECDELNSSTNLADSKSPVNSLKSASPDQLAITSSSQNESNLLLNNNIYSNAPGKQQASQRACRCRSPVSASRLTLNSAICYTQTSPEETFVRLIGSAARRLLAELKSQLPLVYDPQSDELLSILQSLNDDENNRIYHLELIELNSQVSFILLIPSAENVCPVTSQEKSNILADNKEYMLLPLQIFETIHINTYEPDLLGKYSRLSAILETDLIVAQHDHRQAFSSNELKSTKSRVNHLQDMVSMADDFWRQLRWIVDVVSFARDKSLSVSNGGIKLGTIWRYFDLTPSTSYDHSATTNNNQFQFVGNDSLSSSKTTGTGIVAGTAALACETQLVGPSKDCCSSSQQQKKQQQQQKRQIVGSKNHETMKRTTSDKVEKSDSKISFDDEVTSTSFPGSVIDNVPDIVLTQSSTRRKSSKGEKHGPIITKTTTTTTTATTITTTMSSTTTTETLTRNRENIDSNLRERSPSASSSISSASASSSPSSSSSCSSPTEASHSSSSSSTSTMSNSTSNSAPSSSPNSLASSRYPTETTSATTYPCSTKPTKSIKQRRHQQQQHSRKKVTSCPIRRHSGSDTLHASGKLVINSNSGEKIESTADVTTIELNSKKATSFNNNNSDDDDDEEPNNSRNQCQVKCTIFADNLVEVEEIREDELEPESELVTANEPAISKPRIINATQQQQQQLDTNLQSARNSIEASGAGNLQVDERILDFKLREASEDEEAIYAYHISLKDATKGQRRTSQSQHSIRAFVGDNYDDVTDNNNNTSIVSKEDDCNKSDKNKNIEMKTSTGSGFRFTSPTLSTETDAAPNRSASRHIQRQNMGDVFDSVGEGFELAGGESGLGLASCSNTEWIENQFTNKSMHSTTQHPNFRQPFEMLPESSKISNVVETQQQQFQHKIKTKKRHLKSTNPFLSDSLEEYDLD